MSDEGEKKKTLLFDSPYYLYKRTQELSLAFYI